VDACVLLRMRVDELRADAGLPAAAGRLAHTDKKALRVDYATVRIAIRRLYEVDYSPA